MDLDGDGFLDLVTINDGEIVGEDSSSRREHVFRNDGKGRFRDATDAWWPPAQNVGEDDNMVAFLDSDSDGDADFVVGSLSGPDRLLVNDGQRPPDRPPRCLRRRADARHARHRSRRSRRRRRAWTSCRARASTRRRPTSACSPGAGLARDTAPPVITMVGAADMKDGRRVVRARVHDRKSPSFAFEWKRVAVEWTTAAGKREAPMRWYGEYLWRADWPADLDRATPYRVCAVDAAGNAACRAPD